MEKPLASLWTALWRTVSGTPSACEKKAESTSLSMESGDSKPSQILPGSHSLIDSEEWNGVLSSFLQSPMEPLTPLLLSQLSLQRMSTGKTLPGKIARLRQLGSLICVDDKLWLWDAHNQEWMSLHWRSEAELPAPPEKTPGEKSSSPHSSTAPRSKTRRTSMKRG